MKTPRTKSVPILVNEPDHPELKVDDLLGERERVPARIVELAEELMAKIASRRTLH